MKFCSPRNGKSEGLLRGGVVCKGKKFLKDFGRMDSVKSMNSCTVMGVNVKYVKMTRHNKNN